MPFRILEKWLLFPSGKGPGWGPIINCGGSTWWGLAARSRMSVGSGKRKCARRVIEQTAQPVASLPEGLTSGFSRRRGG